MAQQIYSDLEKSKTLTRSFMATAKTVKKHWGRENDIEIVITDGEHTIILPNYHHFEIATDKPLSEQILWQAL